MARGEACSIERAKSVCVTTRLSTFWFATSDVLAN